GTYMGVDVGIKLHVVIRQRLEGDRTRALFIGEVDTFEELGDLITRYDVRRCVIDALPDIHKAREFARARPRKVWLAYYGRQDADHHWEKGKGSDVATVHINKVQALGEMFDLFHKGKAELPSDARHLGGRVRHGIGEYYREMMAPKRALEQNSQGNWVSRYDAGREADHYAHAEVYCMLAGKTGAHLGGKFLLPRRVDLRPRRRGGSGWKWGLR
ncbi:MAG: hypothetical protein V3T24_10790, partial [Longimicrobiales bacterium]